jgi:hypothetical protein
MADSHSIVTQIQNNLHCCATQKLWGVVRKICIHFCNQLKSITRHSYIYLRDQTLIEQ